MSGTQLHGDIDSTWSSGHDGTSGFTQATLLPQIVIMMPAIGPEILTYLCGINDLYFGSPVATALADLQTNINAVFTRSYRLRTMIVGELLPYPGDATIDANVTIFNAGLPTVAATNVALGRDVRIASLNATIAIGATDFDGTQTHPNPVGYGKVAVNGWLPVLAPLLS